MHVLTLYTYGSHSPTIIAVGTREALEAERDRHREEAMDDNTDWDMEDFLADWREELELKGVHPDQAREMFPVEGVAASAQDEARERAVETYRYHIAPVKHLK
jgi:hypothetical protein